MADERTYIRVHDGIEDHPKIAPLSDKAFRLLVTTWGWCSRHLTDGRVPLKVWNKRGTKRARDELLAAKLIEVCDGIGEPTGGYVLMHDYLEHQRSAALVEEKREAKRQGARKGNHNRWHRDQGVHDETCEFCVQDGPPDPSHKRSDSDRSSDSHERSRSDRKTSPETETETETDKRSNHLGRESHVGRASARDRAAALSGNGHSPAAHRLVETYAASCRKRPPAQVRNELAAQVDDLLTENWTADEITAALTAWGAKGLDARKLPSVANEIANAAPDRGRQPALKPNATDAFAAQFLAGGNRPPELRALPGGAS